MNAEDRIRIFGDAIDLSLPPLIVALETILGDTEP